MTKKQRSRVLKIVMSVTWHWSALLARHINTNPQTTSGAEGELIINANLIFNAAPLLPEYS